MSRRQQVARTASPEAVFAQRRGETPLQIYFEISNIGRNVESSKKRARWKFCFGEEGREHEVTLVHSVMSGKKKTFFNGEMINEAQKVSKEWSFAWSFGAHLLRVGINFEEYALVIDGVPFRSFSRRDPYLAAQLEVTKRDSMRSLQTDEQRRFDRLGYTGDDGSSNRSRTAERRRPSAGSANSSGSRRAASNTRGASSDRRSGSVERGTSRSRASPSARASSSRRLQSPPTASGPGDNRRGGGGSGKPTRGSQSAAASNGGAGKKRVATAQASSSADILSADPSTLEVNPFDPHVSDASFDPLASRQPARAPAGAGPGGASLANGAAPQAGGGGGDWTRGGGLAGGFGGGNQEDAAAVLQLGMQFDAMGVSSQFQQQQPAQQQQPPPPPQQQQHQQYVQPQQPQQQQQPPQYQSPFDQGAYQRYDDSGFPQTVQQPYNPPQQTVASDPFSRAPQSFGASAGYGESGFSGGFEDQGQQTQQPQQQQGGGASGQRGEDSKAPLDPWDMARSGMVNIDDITDTKHLPHVEVKPFTNDHRPLADLVREAPPKVTASVMIERPEPPPTHMAVAIVPFQPPGQQQAPYAQGGFPQQQNGNPFAQLQLTQYGHQAAQPVLLSRPNDPFHDL